MMWDMYQLIGVAVFSFLLGAVLMWLLVFEPRLARIEDQEREWYNRWAELSDELRAQEPNDNVRIVAKLDWGNTLDWLEKEIRDVE